VLIIALVFYAAYIFTYAIGTGESAKGSKTQQLSASGIANKRAFLK